MPRRISATVLRCFLVFVISAHFTASDVADDVRDDDVPATPRSPDGRAEVCPSCTSHEVLHQLPQADVVRLHVERIKREMLRKLGLSAPPNVTGRPLPSFHSLPRPLLPANDDVTDEDGVFPDDDVNYATAMSDDVGSPGHEYGDYYYSGNEDDDDDGDDDDYNDDVEDEDGLEGEFDVDDAEFGAPEPPPRTKQIIVFGQQRMSTIDYFKASNFN